MTILRTVVGLMCGLLISILGTSAFIAAWIRDDRARMTDLTDEPSYWVVVWSALTATPLLPYWGIVAGAGAMNGAIGVRAGRLGYRHPAAVVVVPLLLLLFPLTRVVRYPSDSKTWGVELIVTGFVELFVWVSGRVGQRIGAPLRMPEPAATPNPAT